MRMKRIIIILYLCANYIWTFAQSDSINIPKVTLENTEYYAQGFNGNTCRQFNYNLQNGTNWRLFNTDYDTNHIKIQEDLLPQNKLIFQVDKALKTELKLLCNEQSQPISVVIDNSIHANLTTKDDYNYLEITGGIPPYTVVFKDTLESNNEGTIIQIIESNWIIKNDFLLSKGIEGNINQLVISDWDSDKDQKFTIPCNINIKNDNKQKWLIILSITLLIIALYFYIRHRKNQYKTKSQPLRDKFNSMKTVVIDENITGNKLGKIDIAAKNQKIVPINTNNKNIKIRRKETGLDGLLEKKQFLELSNNYVSVDLDHWWTNSCVQTIHLSDGFIESLTNFLKNQKNEQVKEEKVGVVPEVGGFIMGYYTIIQEKNYQVAFEKFIPFVPEYNDVFKIEIGTATLVQELGDAQDKYPDMAVLGWFHTHPGHGLFLSNADLAVQKHFPSFFQIAMEIDSMTSGLDAAFFSYKSDGFPNNYHLKKDGVKWLQWIEIIEN